MSGKGMGERISTSSVILVFLAFGRPIMMLSFVTIKVQSRPANLANACAVPSTISLLYFFTTAAE